MCQEQQKHTFNFISRKRNLINFEFFFLVNATFGGNAK